VSTRQARAAANGQAKDAYQRARQRRLASHPDRYVWATSRYAERGLDACDCPCHWWPGVREAVLCCQNVGLAWRGDGFTSWPDSSEDQP
jgi:hypothetical protein